MRCSVTLIVFIVGMRLTTADGHAQSLGEVAAREAARRAAITTPAPVYTNVPRSDMTRVATPAHSGPDAFALKSSVQQAAEVSTKPAEDVTAPPIVAATPSVRVHAHESASMSARDVTTDQTHSTPQVGLSATRESHAADVRNASASFSPRIAPAASLAGWSAFQIKKTEAELAEAARLADVPPPTIRTGPHDVQVPAQHDAMRISTGIGYLQGADWAMDVSGSGKLNGMHTEITTFVTAGPMGFQPRSGRVSLFSPGGNWRAEGGNLYSDLRGLARGARVSRSVGQRWTPSISLYAHRHGTSDGATALAYSDRFQLLPSVRVGGELTSDGAAFVQGQYIQPRLEATAFYRFVSGAFAGHDKGISSGLNIGGGLAISGAVRLSDAARDSRRWQLASVRVPLAGQASVTLERSWWTGSSDDGSTNALITVIPLGPVRLIQRLQWGRTDYRQRAIPFGFDRRQLQSTASYTPGPWGSVSYQQSTQWFDDGRVQEWDDITSMFQLGPRTSVNFVTAFPDIADPRRLRARVTQRLSPTLQLEAQYGRLSAFQMTRAFNGEQSRVMVTIRKTWQLETPARGGEVRGRAIDQAGYPVSGALVRLGPYSAITDEEGEYKFIRVPDGQFDLALDQDKLPAAYAWDDNSRPLTVKRDSRERIDLQVIPLNAIRGRVYLDGNRNGRFDDDEGVPNAVLAVNGSVTATTPMGSYAFYNQPPGRYKIRLDVQRLAKGLAPASPAELDVELTGDQPLLGVDFRVEKKDMPVIMREIPR